MLKWSWPVVLASGLLTIGTNGGCSDDEVGASTSVGGSSTATTVGTGGTAPNAPLNELILAATHNSYSGGEDLGTIVEQLDAGARFVEFDLHDNDYATLGFQVGHDAPGDEVAHGAGNPAGNSLVDWLATVATWSGAHPNHVPIIVGLDIKDDLTDNRSFAEGDLMALNRLLVETAGAGLFKPQETMPTLADTRGRILFVLSGHEGSRFAYRRQLGSNPAVALNASGQLVQVHDNGAGELWFWAGQLGAGGRVDWKRHGRYDTGDNPAIALNDAGLIVEVHEDPDMLDNQLWYRVGKLNADFDIEWSAPSGQAFPSDDSGNKPSLAFVSGDSNLVREIHESPAGGQRWYWNGVLDAAATMVAWSRDNADGGMTADPLFDEDSATVGAETVAVSVGPYAAYGDALLVARNAGPAVPIRYQQLMFVEVQTNSDDRLKQDPALVFYAGNARLGSHRDFAVTSQLAGKIVRLWTFNDESNATTPPVTLPATDELLQPWYQQYCASVGCIP